MSDEEPLLLSQEETNTTAIQIVEYVGDTELFNLLTEFNLSYAFESLTSCGFTLEKIKFINKDDLEVIFPGKEHTALKAELREKINTWKAKNFPSEVLCQCSFTASQWVQNERFSGTSTPVSDRTNFLYNTSVLDILKSSKAGQDLLLVNSVKNKLEKEDRRKLLNCLVEYYFDPKLNRYKVPSARQQDKIADEIIEVFPTETKDIYFVSRKTGHQANPSGLLFNRLNNLNRKRKSSDVLTNKSVEEEETCEVPPSGNQNDMMSMKNKIKLMQNDDSEAMELWMQTFSYRQEDIKSHENLNEILEEWPFFKQSGGERFINYDFGCMFPDKLYHLTNKWEDISKKLYKFYECNIKDKTYKVIYNSLNDEHVDKNCRDCILFMLLNTVLTPTARFVSKSGKKSIVTKSTIEDAIKSIIIHLKTVNDLELQTTLKLKTSISKKQTIQPYLLIVGADLTNIKEFYVSFGDYLLKFNSFLFALDICFKIFQVFNLQYPKEASLSWLFIQSHVFDITTVYDKKSPKLSEFIQNIQQCD